MVVFKEALPYHFTLFLRGLLLTNASATHNIRDIKKMMMVCITSMKTLESIEYF